MTLEDFVTNIKILIGGKTNFEKNGSTKFGRLTLKRMTFS